MPHATLFHHRLAENFLRPARTTGEHAADLLRVIGLVSLVVVAFGWGFVAMAVFALSMLGVVLPRFLGARATLDLAVCIAVLVAAWSAVLQLYQAISWWDIVVHCTLNGLIAALAWVLCAQLGVSLVDAESRYRFVLTVGLTTAFGLALGAVWEMWEWFGHNYLDESIYVSYTDTIGDIAAGGIGSLIAGCSMRFLAGANRGG